MSQRPKLSKLKEAYQKTKEAKVGAMVCCPSCKTEFVKKSYQQVFCKTKLGTTCKDFYWNNVTPTKRNNTTRISPASAAYMAKQMSLNAPNIVGGSGKISGYTSEGYRIMDGIAYDEWDDPVYQVDPNDDTHPFDLD